MGAQTSKEEQLYQQVNYGNVHGIQHLRREGAGLEFIDKEGKTPLIVACMRPDLLPVAKCLIDLGANVNAYRPGCHAGAPLHHAAKRGLEQTVNLLLSHGANPSVTNDDCLTPLDLARAKGHINVVRAIETHMRLFSGWIRELYGPGFLEVLAPQWASRKIWAVVLPCDHRNPMNPAKFELVIYPELQVAKPRTTIALWKAKIEEPNFSQPDPMLVIVDKNSRSRFRFLAANEGDKQQLLSFYNACRGMREVNCPHPAIPATAQVPPLLPNAVISTAAANAPTVSEDMELAMAINASIQSAMIEGISPLSDVRPLPQLPCTNDWASSDNATHNGWGSQDVPSSSSKINNGWTDEPANDAYNGWVVPEPARSTNLGLVHESQHYTSDVTPVLQNTEAVSHPSAPPITEAVFDDGPILYPSVDSSPVDFKLPDVESRPGTSETKEGSGGSSSCVICLDAPVEGACIPCGHMAGCMSCLNEIKKKKWGCPVCRANIDQVIKLFAV